MEYIFVLKFTAIFLKLFQHVRFWELTSLRKTCSTMPHRRKLSNYQTIRQFSDTSKHMSIHCNSFQSGANNLKRRGIHRFIDNHRHICPIYRINCPIQREYSVACTILLHRPIDACFDVVSYLLAVGGAGNFQPSYPLPHLWEIPPRFR